MVPASMFMCQIWHIWKPFSTNNGAFWHGNFGIDPKLAEKTPLFCRATDVPFLQRMEQGTKLAKTIMYQLWHISD